MKKLFLMIVLVSVALTSCNEDNTSKTTAKTSDSTNKKDSVIAKFGDLTITENNIPPKPEFTEDEIPDFSYMIGYDLGMSLVNEKVERDYNEFVQGYVDQYKKNKLKYTEKEMQVIKNQIEKFFSDYQKTIKPGDVDPPPPVMPKDLIPKFSYLQGIDISQRMLDGSMTVDIDDVSKGILEAAAGKPNKLSDEVKTNLGNKYSNLMNYIGFMKQREWEQKSKDMKTKGPEYYEKVKKSGEYAEDKDGYLFKILKKGKGKKAQTDDLVSLHVRLYHIDGSVIDDSYKKEAPIKVPLNRTIKAFSLPVPKMTIGSKWKIVAPADLFFGERGMPPDFIGNEPVTMEVELISIDGKSEPMKEQPGMPGPGGMMPPGAPMPPGAQGGMMMPPGAPMQGPSGPGGQAPPTGRK